MTWFCLSRSNETHALWLNQFSNASFSCCLIHQRSSQWIHVFDLAQMPFIMQPSPGFVSPPSLEPEIFHMLGECVNYYTFTSKRAKYYSRENRFTLTGFCFVFVTEYLSLCATEMQGSLGTPPGSVLRELYTVRLILSWLGVCMHEAVRHSVCLSQWAELQQQTLVELLTH